MGNNNKIALARFSIANLEQIIEDIQCCINVDIMPPKRRSTTEAHHLTQAAIMKLVADKFSAAQKAQRRLTCKYWIIPPDKKEKLM
ncbi:hypothetical protein Tco_0250330 [Tanacetum coccineum]